MPDVETMIHEIMKPSFKTLALKDYKKYVNKNFLILKNQRTILVIDNRYDPPQIHSNLQSAYEKIRKQR